jgi:hypothetical protein
MSDTTYTRNDLIESAREQHPQWVQRVKRMTRNHLLFAVGLCAALTLMPGSNFVFSPLLLVGALAILAGVFVSGWRMWSASPEYLAEHGPSFKHSRWELTPGIIILGLGFAVEASLLAGVAIFAGFVIFALWIAFNFGNRDIRDIYQKRWESASPSQ